MRETEAKRGDIHTQAIETVGYFVEVCLLTAAMEGKRNSPGTAQQPLSPVLTV